MSEFDFDEDESNDYCDNEERDSDEGKHLIILHLSLN